MLLKLLRTRGGCILKGVAEGEEGGVKFSVDDSASGGGDVGVDARRVDFLGKEGEGESRE